MRPKIEVIGGDFLLTQEAAGVLANVSVQTMKKWEKQDNPPPRNADGSYSAKEFGPWLSTHRGHRKAGAPGHVGRGNRDEAEIRLKEAQASKVERENSVAEGLLINAQDADTAWQNILMRVRGRLLKIPTGLATLLVGDNDVHSVQSKLKDAVYEALSELSEDWKDRETDATVEN